MTLREIAVEFVTRFCQGDAEGLGVLMASDLRFTGPLASFASRDDYLTSLRDNLAPTDFEILSVGLDDRSVVVFYDYHRPDGPLTIGQLFRFDADDRISEILVVFDASRFMA